jgi:hypothetical protein
MAPAGRGRISVATLGVIAAAGLIGLSLGAMIARSPPAHPATAAVVTNAPPPWPEPQLLEASLAPPASRGLPRRAGDGGPRAACAPRCSHTDLMAADRRLRAAYSRAVRAGVPRRVLVAYRNRWADLRHDAVWRPSRVASGYGAMAGDLNRMAQRRRAHAVRGFWS